MTSAWDVPQPYVSCILEGIDKIFVVLWVISRCVCLQSYIYIKLNLLSVENNFMAFKIEVNL